jgi:hypothetical protein
MKNAILYFCLFLFTQNMMSQTIYIACGKLVDTQSGKITTKKTFIVKDNKIFNVIDG